MNAVALSVLSVLPLWYGMSWLYGIAAIGGLIRSLFSERDSVEKRIEQAVKNLQWLGTVSADVAKKVGELAFELRERGRHGAVVESVADAQTHAADQLGLELVPNGPDPEVIEGNNFAVGGSLTVEDAKRLATTRAT